MEEENKWEKFILELAFFIRAKKKCERIAAGKKNLRKVFCFFFYCIAMVERSHQHWHRRLAMLIGTHRHYNLTFLSGGAVREKIKTYPIFYFYLRCGKRNWSVTSFFQGKSLRKKGKPSPKTRKLHTQMEVELPKTCMLLLLPHKQIIQE